MSRLIDQVELMIPLQVQNYVELAVKLDRKYQ